ncbi:hypothetical protein ACJMK2_023040 [Sinanodonta woodiana]|uniref:Uncharacterized protein n=1 Tax=Sinanodonta woodiana TaxID=1069815 RepID=A0ABD3T348_SINWO
MMTPLFLPTALVVLMTASASSFCPKKCICGAKSVSCFGMTAFDMNFPSLTEKITFWHSNISNIPGRIFSNVGQELFHSSQRSIHFQNSIIGTIEAEAFINLQNFESILFENVNISRINEGSFKNLKNIGSFSFLQSNIGIIDQNAFVNFRNISDFRISNTKIESIFDKAFCNLQNISKFEILLSRIIAMDNNSFSSFQGISWFELSFNTFESIGCNSLIEVSLASNYSKFVYNSFPCDCNLSFLKDINYCTYAGGRTNIGMNSELGECSPCLSVTHASHSLSIVISTTDSAADGSVTKEGVTTGGLHSDYNTTSTEPWNGTLLATVNMSNPSLALSKLEVMTTITTTTTTITKHSATLENQSASAICSGTCLINNWTSIYNTESTTPFTNAAKDFTEETRAVITNNSSSLKISPEVTSKGFPASSATTLPPRSLATILLPRLSTPFISTRSPIALARTSSPASSTTSSPLFSSKTSTPASLSTTKNALFGEYNFTAGYGNKIGLYNGTLSKVSSSSSNTAPAISTTIFRVTSSQSSPLSTKTELVLATTTTTTATNMSVHNSSSKSNMAIIYLSTSVESSIKPFSAPRDVNNLSSISATQPSSDTSLGKTSSSFSSSSSNTIYPKIAFPLWSDATRVSKKTTGVTSEPIRGRSSRTHVNKVLPVTTSCILAFTLRILIN